MSNEQLVEYYTKTGADSERAYAEAARQHDLAQMREQAAALLRGHVVLELACGTGYWTDAIAASADSVLAIDINQNMVELARQRTLTAGKVRFRVADAFKLPEDLGEFTAVFAGGWWSSVLREEQDAFLAQLRKRVGKDVLLVLLDEVYVEGESESIARTDAHGNTWQIVLAPDGQRYELPKSYPTDSGLRKRLAGAVREIKIARNDYYWLLSSRLK
jgi:protein-L-isoaspartate O-methyltransferase